MKMKLLFLIASLLVLSATIVAQDPEPKVVNQPAARAFWRTTQGDLVVTSNSQRHRFHIAVDDLRCASEAHTGESSG